MATNIDRLKNKIQNGGLTAQGKLSAEEFNLLVEEEITVIEKTKIAAYLGADDGSGGYIDEDGQPVDLSDYAKKTDLAAKQDTLQSGVNIKTINGETILGSGNISVSGGSGGGGDVNVIESISVNGTAQAVTNKNVDISVPTDLSDLTEDTTHRTVTDTEKSAWNGKQAALVSGSNIKTVNGESILGSGNISVSGGTGGDANVIESITFNGNSVPVTNKNAAITVSIPSALSDLTADASHRVVTDTEKNTWNSKQAALESGTNIKTINGESILGSGNISVSGASGGEANVIESVKVNGTPLSVTNKAVDITAVPAGIVTQDTTHRMVSDTEKSTWNGKANASDLGSYLPLTGGTVTGMVKFVSSNSWIRQNNSEELELAGDGGIRFVDDIIATSSMTCFSSISAASFIKSGGTSAQFLKADGSVDSNEYLTAASYGKRVQFDAITLGFYVDSEDPVHEEMYIDNNDDGHITYSYGGTDIGPNSIVTGYISVVGGTSSQFLKADGSVDSNTYLTTETDPTVPSWAKQATKPTYTASEVGALPASTTIPSALSDLTADSTHRLVTDAEKTEWNAKTSNTGTITKVTTTAGAHTAVNVSSGAVSFNVPTATSHLTNDSGFVTSSSMVTVYSGSSAPSSSLGSNGDIYIQTS